MSNDEDIAVKSLATAFQFGVALGFAKKYNEMHEVVKEVKKAITLEREFCEDAVSRQAVLDLCDKKTKYDIPYEYYEGKKHIKGWDEGRIINFTKLMQLPSVIPQPKTGHCEDAISRQAIKEQMLYYGFCAPDMTVTKFVEDLPSVNPQEPKIGRCKDCKWWKDSDSMYRRGSHAESQCPINRKEVFEGNGYCYMYKPREAEEEVNK